MPELTIINEMKDYLRFGIDLESDPVASGLGVAVVSAREVILEAREFVRLFGDAAVKHCHLPCIADR
jgi:hypothetical protein